MQLGDKKLIVQLASIGAKNVPVSGIVFKICSNEDEVIKNVFFRLWLLQWALQ